MGRHLRNSFPEKSERELAVIRRRFYRTLSEIFVDTINMAYMCAQPKGLQPEALQNGQIGSFHACRPD